jgi:hypothetical protein
MLTFVSANSQNMSELSGHSDTGIFSNGDKKGQLPSAAYFSFLNEALNFQYIADSLTNLALLLRNTADKVSNDEKQVLKSRISGLERSVAEFQKKADDQLMVAKSYSEDNSEKKALVPNNVGTGTISEHQQSEKTLRNDNYIIINDTTGIRNTGSLIVGKSENINGTDLTVAGNQKTVKEMAGPQKKPADVYSVFEITEKPTYKTDEKVPVNINVEPGLIYRIQVAVFKNPVSPSYFKGISPVCGFRTEGSDLTIYYAGMFRKSANASPALVKVRSAGFKDAFIVALMDNRIVSNERAATLEKEWGKKPFTLQGPMKSVDTVKDTIPQLLVFRVEVQKIKKPLTDEKVDNLKRMAGSRGLDLIKNASGQTIYLIGKFLTFESATEYTDLLSRNGYKEARVTAYLGAKEIPVETARQLFEKY